MAELCFMTAVELRAALGRREVSAREVVQAHLDQIERFNPAVNAVVTLVAERALDGAAAADRRAASGADLPALHGLPVAHKDVHETAGIRTTYGSPVRAQYVPAEDELVIERMHAAGVITLGKTNVPEFGAGSHTFNPVFGATRNPYDRSRSAGGSSGGAAVALACGMHPIADGSDMGGSLRNPASFNNVVGLRPSPGRVPGWPALLGWSTLNVSGPMARTVADAALLLSVLAGPDPRTPSHCGSRAAGSPRRWSGMCAGCGWPGRPIWVAPSRSSPKSPRRSAAPRRYSPRWAARWPRTARRSPERMRRFAPCGPGSSRSCSARCWMAGPTNSSPACGITWPAAAS